MTDYNCEDELDRARAWAKAWKKAAKGLKASMDEFRAPDAVEKMAAEHGRFLFKNAEKIVALTDERDSLRNRLELADKVCTELHRFFAKIGT